MNILITGSTGLIGTALTDYLASMGHVVYPLVRNKDIDCPFYWNPSEHIIHLDESISIDVVIHLAGENIADSRWNKKKKKLIVESREQGTKLLCEALVKLSHKPELLISGSAIGFYGETTNNIVTEDSLPGTGFLSEIAKKWEAATQVVENSGIRLVHMRTGIVLSPNGGVLKKMMLPVNLGLGGIIGSGQQYMSWVSINDMLHIIEFIIANRQISGPVNMVSNTPVTNYEFIKTLGKILHRPTVIPFPAFMAKLLFGEMAEPLLLSSTRVNSIKLEQAGYRYVDNTLEDALSSLLKSK